jgi:succinate dehydrogenase/fumarate reductase flavoprotein subunit
MTAVTQGGPRKNGRAQVLDAFNNPINPIPHLYCVGELGSIYGFLYPSPGGNLCQLLVFGRVASATIMNRIPASSATAGATRAAEAAETTAPATVAARAEAQTAAPAAAKETCLEYHGPFDKLSSPQIDHTAPQDEKINPHRFVPHQARDANAIPERSSCHTPHAVPHTGTDSRSPATVSWCCDSCHHQRSFIRCTQCHE